MAYTTINKSTDYFNTKLFTGNGADNHAITGVGFQPDWIWAKNRATTDAHHTADSVNGAGYRLRTNTDDALGTQADGVKSFDSDGFTLGTTGSINGNGNAFVAWNWKANGAGSANTDGSINTTATSANTTAGFSISKYTGTGSNATVGHGLGAVPKMIIVKNLSDVDNWVVYHNSLGNTDGLYLNTTDSTVGTNTFWNNTTPTTTVFSVGTHNRVNGSGDNMIAYCFAEKTGYSKFGSYTGNGNADGTFVYTGFKPAFYIIKSATGTRSWIIKDNKRPGYNVNGSYLLANGSEVEATGSGNVASDECSNGFKIRGTSTSLNFSGETYIYMAFAEAPLVGTNGVTAKAR